MADKLDPKRRSENMRRIRSTGMSPELAVRSEAHRLGFRFRLHRKDLPGRPDLVFPARGVAIFVHGCFWHQHRKCIDGRPPKSNRSYWEPKLAGNLARDRRAQRKLRYAGWRVLTVWECETKDPTSLRRRLRYFLDG